jgi:hypothetical protein
MFEELGGRSMSFFRVQKMSKKHEISLSAAAVLFENGYQGTTI